MMIQFSLNKHTEIIVKILTSAPGNGYDKTNHRLLTYLQVQHKNTGQIFRFYPNSVIFTVRCLLEWIEYFTT